MNIAALVLTVVFIADDPSLPLLALELAERPAERQLILAWAAAGATPTTTSLRDSAGRRVLPAGAFPMAPVGASVSPAVDGVIVTLEDAGALAAVWTPPPPTAPPPKKGASTTKAPKVHPWPPPSLPVLGPRGLRLFLPAIVDGAPMSASLHVAGGATVPGFAVAFTRTVDDPSLSGGLAVARGGDDVDVGGPRLLGVASTCGGDQGGPLLLRQTTGATSGPRCEAGLEVRSLLGTRSGDLPAKDTPARGLVLRRAAPSAPASPPAPTTPTTPTTPTSSGSPAR